MSYSTLSGATRVIAIIGDPIAQVKSPANVTRMLNERGHDTVVIPIEVPPRDVDGFIRGLSLAKNCDSILVTIPHKFATYAHCATASDRADFLGSVSILRRNADGGWHGEMLDGLGMLGGIKSQGGDPNGKRTLLIGAGGAGSAIALALLEAGASHLAIHDADATRRDTLIARLKERFDARVSVGSADPTGFGMVVNATPMGMRPGDPFPVEVAKLAPDAFAACVITAPLVSPWIEAARARGCKTSVGVDMFTAEMSLMVDFLVGER